MHGLGLHQLDLHNQQLQQQPQRRRSSRYGLRGAGGGGEIVEVQGGHIVRSTGRKDRHSKVCTAKGPRDRRVRLAAHTAIQFYDVQDRLGYDRPSKAVDWLMKNAKASIDELAELPPWTPTATKAASSSSRAPASFDQSPKQLTGDSNGKEIQVAEPVGSSSFSFGGDNNNTSFLPPSLDSDAIADTIKSFFPMAVATSPMSSTTIGFQNYPPDLFSRTSSHNHQDLRLSLQSFPEAPPAFHHPQSTQQYHNHSSATFAQGALFSSAANLAFDGASATWADQNQRMVPWNAAEASGLPPPRQAVPLHSVLGPSLFLSQRGPLQSSNSPSVRAWPDSAAADDNQMLHSALHPTMSSVGFASGVGFSGFRIPARIHGEEEHDGISDKPPSASSTSHH